MTVCIDCGVTLPDGPQELHSVEPDPARFPLSAARGRPFSYRLCRACDSALGPRDREGLEVRLIAALEAGLLLEQLAERLTANTFRTDPGVRSAAQDGLAFHRRYQAQATAALSLLHSVLQPLRDARPSVRSLLGQTWFESLEALEAAHERSIHESREATSLLQQRLGGGASEPGV